VTEWQEHQTHRVSLSCLTTDGKSHLRHPRLSKKHLCRTSRYDTGLLGDAFLVGATAGGQEGQLTALQTASWIRTPSASCLTAPLIYRFCRSNQKLRSLISDLVHQKFIHWKWPFHLPWAWTAFGVYFIRKRKVNIHPTLMQDLKQCNAARVFSPSYCQFHCPWYLSTVLPKKPTYRPL